MFQYILLLKLLFTLSQNAMPGVCCGVTSGVSSQVRGFNTLRDLDKSPYKPQSASFSSISFRDGLPPAAHWGHCVQTLWFCLCTLNSTLAVT